MGTEALWVPLVLSAIGTGVSVYNTRKTAKKTDRALASQIEKQAKKRQEADARTGQLIDKTAASSPEGARKSALDQYVTQLKAASPTATSGLAARGGASDRFNQEAAAAALGVQNYGQNQAELSSRIDAPQRQRDEEAFSRSRAASDLGEIGRSATARNFLDSLLTQNAGRRNVGLDALAGLLSGAASGYGGASGAGAGAGAGYGVTDQGVRIGQGSAFYPQGGFSW